MTSELITGTMLSNAHSNLVISPLSLPVDTQLSDLFASWADSPYSLFLQSGGSGSTSRYSIALREPVVCIESRHGHTTVRNCITGEVTKTSESPLQVADNYLLQLKAQTSIDESLAIRYEDLPFLIGCAGLCSYDLGRYYESLPSVAKADYACPDMAFGIYDRALIEDAVTGEVLDVRLDNHRPISINAEINTHSPFTLTGDWTSNLSKDDYCLSLGKIHAYLLAGDCYQVNMAQRFTAPYSGSEWLAYKTLCEANSAPFSAFMRVGDSAILSISPERFIAVRKGKVETRPIKGTRPRSSDPITDKLSAEALLKSEKDRAENLMIVDLLRNDLSKHCKPGTVDVPSLFALESYAAVHHMVSTVTGELSENSTPLTLLAGAFPGGSITGAPKVRAMEIIDELEPHRRSVYCGSMVYAGIRDDLDSSICIRTVLAEHGQLYCWAGGGIVLDSDAEEEYQETLDKVSRILPVLAEQNE